jgi:3-deoxy-D-manno-octulosonic-acid transferase
MIALYRIIATLIYMVFYPYGRIRASTGSRMWQGRLGRLASVSRVDIWMHAASVGEVKVIGFLLSYLKERSPELKIHVTAVTRQGFRIAEKEFGDAASVSYFPLDVSFAVKRFIDRLKPRMIVVAETEIWPNLVRQAARHKIPMILVNGRMTRGSFGKYRLIKNSLGKILAEYDRFFFKTAEDARRYSQFGVGIDKSVVAGDMKFDAPLQVKTPQKVAEIRARCGVGKEEFLLVAGSTRSGEEALMLAAIRSLRTPHKQLRLVIAPRHVERAAELKSLLDSEGVSYYTYGEHERPSHSNDQAVVLVDRMGLLNDLYLAADLAFVGGTLVDIGGHNILEPVWAGTPVIYGPSLGNVTEAAEYIESHNYGVRVKSSDKLTLVIDDVISGRMRFAVKTESDLSESATARAGEYILERLKHA